MHQFWPRSGWAEGRKAGKGGEVGGGEGGDKSFQVKTRATSRPQMVLTTQLDRRDTIQVEGRIPGWLHPIGMLMVLQGCKSTPRKADQLSLAMGDMLGK